MPSSELDPQNYHQKYKNLKRRLKYLIYENECFQEELRKVQKRLLKLSRDKSFLLDRLLKHETVESSSSDSEATISSDSDSEIRAEMLALKKKKTNADAQESSTANSSSNNVNEPKKKKSRKAYPAAKPGATPPVTQNIVIDSLAVRQHGDGHMTSEEIERHLESKQTLRDLIPEKAPLTVPAEMFSNEPLECDIMENEVSSITSTGVVDNVGIIIDIND